MASRATMGGGAKQRLMTEMASLQNEKWVHIEDSGDNIFRWKMALMVVNSESVFDGAYLRAEMSFTPEYPYQPPKFKFLIPIYHPNVYNDGQLCISILHKPGEDAMSGEDASERWSPLQGVESVLRSVLLLLDQPEITSPANVDAGVMYRDKRSQYNARARETVAASKRDIPAGFTLPSSSDLVEKPSRADDDDDFWNEGDDEDFDFGASDSDVQDDDDDEEEADTGDEDDVDEKHKS